MARIFISHSAKEASPAEVVREAVRQELKARGHEVFVDSDITAGDQWRARLLDELGRCDAAVVILDQEAIKSHWVRREVYCLLWRYYLGSVQIRGVLVDGVRASRVREQGFGELVELQLITDRHGRTDAGQLAKAAIDDLGVVRVVKDDTMRRWINRVFNVLCKVHTRETLDDFAEALGVSTDDLSKVFENELHHFLARQLLGRPEPVQTLRAVETLEGALGRDDLRTLAAQVLPALIDSESARPLVVRDLREQNRPRPVFVLNAELTSTSELYVMRAGCAARSYRHQAVSSSVTGPDMADDLERECEAAVARLLCVRGSPAWVKRRLAEYRPGPAVAVHAGYLAIEATHDQMSAIARVVGSLRDRYPWLAIIILTGAGRPEGIGTWGLDDVMVLDPPLGETEEHDVDEIVLALGAMVGERLLT